MTLPTPNTLLRMHWAKRRRMQRQVCKLVWIALRETGIRMGAPLDRCRVLVTRYSRRRPDVDAKNGTAKLLLDVLQPSSKRHPEGLGVIADDTDTCIVEFHVETDVVIEPVGT
jgi:hypothetical protein